MALQISTGLRNGLMGGISGTSGFKTIFANGIVRIYDGNMPASPDDAVTGNLLCTFSAINFSSGTAGTISKTGTTVTGVVSVAGQAGYFRLSEAVDSPGSNSTTANRVDGLIGLSDQVNADYVLPELTVAVGQSLSIQLATFGLPMTP